MADNQSIIGNDVIFKGKISNSKTIEINGRVEADIKSEKITLGKSLPPLSRRLFRRHGRVHTYRLCATP